MHCNARTMIKIAAALGGVLAVAYLAVPQAREFVAASAPVLLSLVCPVSMVVMMFMMRKSSGAERAAAIEPQRPALADQPAPGTPPAQAKEAAAP